MAVNWKTVAKQDRQLREAAEASSEALAELRYRNTIGATPKVSFAEYARQCGVNQSQVRNYAKGYEIMATGHDSSISDAIMRASTSSERADVIEAVAEAKGVSPKVVQAHHRDEVRRVEGIARERASKQGTTVKDEATKIARTGVQMAKADKDRKAQRAKNIPLRYIELEKHLNNAKRALMNAVAVEVDLDDDHREFLTDAIGKVRALLNLVEVKFTGAADIDWDAELTRLTGE